MKSGKDALASMTPNQIVAMSALGMAPSIVIPMLRLNGLVRPPFNLIISNVPGPRSTQYLNGARLTGTYPVSVPMQGMALNITCNSYADDMCFGLTGCRRAVPHLQRLLTHLDEELDRWRSGRRGEARGFTTDVVKPGLPVRNFVRGSASFTTEVVKPVVDQAADATTSPRTGADALDTASAAMRCSSTGDGVADLAQDRGEGYVEGLAQRGQQLGGGFLLAALDLGDVAQADPGFGGELAQSHAATHPLTTEHVAELAAKQHHLRSPFRPA